VVKKNQTVNLLTKIQKNQFVWGFITAAILSLCFTALVINYSEKSGKLAFPPWYDDSHSMVEGALRLMTFQQDGLNAAWMEYLARPPHSFLHYYWTSLLYALFGMNDSVVYWGNSAFVFLALLAMSSLLGRVGFAKILYLVAFLCVPVVFNVIYDFRSECALAPLLFCASSLMVLAVLNPEKIWRYTILSGFLFALGFGIKPAMFPYTFGMMGAASLVWLLFTPDWKRMVGVNFPSILKILYPVVVLCAIAILPFSFHYWFNKATIWGYIDSIAFKSEFYRQGGDFWSQATYHLSGFPAMLNLGIYKWPLLLLAGGAAVCTFFLRNAGDRRLSQVIRCLFFLTCCSYLGIAVNQMVQNYFCMTFNLLLAATALTGLAWGASILPKKWAFVPPLILALGFLFVWRIPVSQDYVAETAKQGAGAVAWRKEAPARVFEVIRREIPAHTCPVVWFGCHGWLDGNTLSWEAIKHGLKWRALSYYERSPSVPGQPPDNVDFVVMCENGLSGLSDLPLNPGIPEMILNIEKNPTWSKLATLSDPNGKLVLIYKKSAL
jgi:hypothetical protein